MVELKKRNKLEIMEKMKMECDNKIIEELMKLMASSISMVNEKYIYAFSLYVEDVNDNPCKPTVLFGYNTEKQVKTSLKSSSDEIEARWNYAFWLQNELFSFGKENTADNIKNWIEAKGLPFYEDDSLAWNDEKTFKSTEKIANQNIEANGNDLVKEFVRFVKG